jgi:hypothetical protein
MIETRRGEWSWFSGIVDHHIEYYTVKQYGEKGQDRCTELSPREIMNDMKRRCARFGNNARGPEEEKRDMVKLAHEACIIWHKLNEVKE